jgi:outer membrane lipoprotein-sorting protein
MDMRAVYRLTILLLLCGFAIAPLRAATPTKEEKEKLEKVLRQLDEAAKNFHSCAADFEYDTVQTDPVPDTDKQKGTIYYERADSRFRMAAHIKEHNGKPYNTIYTYTNGQFQLFEGASNQVTRIAKASQFESYMILGFGASGKELEDKWEVTDKGIEVLDGVKTEKLELIARDPAVRKTVPKVTIWVDIARGVSLKQLFEETGGEFRVSVYFNFKVNEKLNDADFKLPVNDKTTYVSH